MVRVAPDDAWKWREFGVNRALCAFTPGPLVREGARRMLAVAPLAEVDAYIEQFASERDEHGAAGGSQRHKETKKKDKTDR